MSNSISVVHFYKLFLHQPIRITITKMANATFSSHHMHNINFLWVEWWWWYCCHYSRYSIILVSINHNLCIKTWHAPLALSTTRTPICCTIEWAPYSISIQYFHCCISMQQWEHKDVNQEPSLKTHYLPWNPKMV